MEGDARSDRAGLGRISIAGLRRAWIGGALFLFGAAVGAGAGLLGTDGADRRPGEDRARSAVEAEGPSAPRPAERGEGAELPRGRPIGL